MTPTFFFWETFLTQNREYIIDQWQKRLHSEVSEHYAKRPIEELFMTTGKACDAFFRVLAFDDYTMIDDFIGEITQIRLEAGFRLADVQRAFELYRMIIVPLLVEHSPKDILCSNIEAVNNGLAYTIHNFSNHFQKMHETYLKEYAKRLEKAVAERTAELKDSEQRYKSLVEEIRDGYLVLNKDTISLVNTEFCRMHAADMDDVLKSSFLSFVAPEDRHKVEQLVSVAAMDDSEPDAIEYLRRTKDGRYLHTEINFKPSWFKGKEYHLCIVRDITKRVEMEKSSREMERMAYIGQLTTSLSHEIRNPLSSVKMNLQILGKNNTFRGNDKKRLNISEREIQRLEGILQQLLDFAKPVALRLSEVDLNKIVSACIELLEVRLSKRQILCDIEMAEHLPLLMADKGKLEQVVINLLLNALDSVEEQGTIKIETFTRHVKKSVFAVIRIQDDGKGIPKEFLPHIFEPFYTTKTTGTGLGLANVKQIVAAHNGMVQVADVETASAAFEVLLPLRRR